MTRHGQNTIRISEEADVVLAGRQTKALLGEFECDERTIQEVTLVVHELASNIVKHAGKGSIEITLPSNEHRDSIEIRAIDSGPGITDIDQAVVDGYSTVGSLGGGLGAVHRLMDDVVIHSDGAATSGVKVVATRRSSAPLADEQVPPIEVDAATRPQPAYEKNGDAFLIEDGPDWTLIGVIDGLGHGPEAHHAASTARQYVQTHSTQPLADLFAGVEEACRSTRGVVMLLSRFDWNTNEVRLGSVGNITVKVCESRNPLNLIPERGVLGGRAPPPVIEQWEFHPTLAMVIHTDGISSRWNCDEFDGGKSAEDAPTADDLLRRFSKQDDDATILVIRGTAR